MPKLKQIVFQGEPGANSHLAIQEAYPKAAAIPAATFEDCYAADTNGSADLGMIPSENSLAGRVADIHHLLPLSGLHIIGEHFLPIHFQLMVPKGGTLKEIKTVHSHIHALGQSRDYIPAWVADSALYVADVGRVKVGLGGQVLLGEALGGADGFDGFADPGLPGGAGHRREPSWSQPRNTIGDK